MALMLAETIENSGMCRAICGGCCAIICVTGAQQYFQTKMWGSESSSRTAGCFPRRWHDGSKEEAFDKAERLDLEKERAATTTEQPKARESMRMGEREEKGDAFEEIKGEGGERDNPVAREGDEERERDDAERRENGKMVLEGPR